MAIVPKVSIASAMAPVIDNALTTAINASGLGYTCKHFGDGHNLYTFEMGPYVTLETFVLKDGHCKASLKISGIVSKADKCKFEESMGDNRIWALDVNSENIQKSPLHLSDSHMVTVIRESVPDDVVHFAYLVEWDSLRVDMGMRDLNDYTKPNGYVSFIDSGIAYTTLTAVVLNMVIALTEKFSKIFEEYNAISVQN